MLFKVGDLVQPLKICVSNEVLHSMIMEVTQVDADYKFGGTFIHVYCHYCIDKFYNAQDWLIFFADNLRKL